jgi:antitoxin MazE
MRTELLKWGKTLAVRITTTVAAKAELREGDCLEIVAAGPGRVVIRSSTTALTLSQLLSQITPENRHDKADWAGAVGREMW